MGIPLLRGREFRDSDRAGSPLVAIINETLARRFFPGQDPVAKRLRRGGPESNGAWLEIVGVTGDARDRMPKLEPRPEIYLPYSQFPNSAADLAYMTLIIRTSGEPVQLTDVARAQVRAISKEPTIGQILPMEDIVAGALGPERLPMFLFGGFAVVALVLGAVGMYGVIAYSVVQRTHEIGIRMALGAQPRDVLRLVVAQGLRPALLGVCIGLAGAFAFARAITSLLFGVSPADAMTYAAVTVLLLGVALLACWVPARRAMRVDPMVALRYE
jgi:putative ABC transport system permease protein